MTTRKMGEEKEKKKNKFIKWERGAHRLGGGETTTAVSTKRKKVIEKGTPNFPKKELKDQPPTKRPGSRWGVGLGEVPPAGGFV